METDTWHYYKVDSRLVVEEPLCGPWEWNPETEEWQAGPGMVKLYEQADPISQQELLKYAKALKQLAQVAYETHRYRVVLNNSRKVLFLEMIETEFLDDIEKFSGQEQMKIKTALSIAKEVHKNQTRDEGSPYISHCIAVAIKAIEYKGNVDDVIVCLLHDSYEDFDRDRDAFAEQINNEFGEHIANSIIKLSKWRSDTKIDNNDYLKELSLDLINLKRKGYDRISNLECLRFTNKEKRTKYIKETEEKYIPLFDRFYPEISEQMKYIIELYHNNKLLLTELDKKTLNLL